MRTGSQVRDEWFNAYVAAMLEGDMEKVPTRVEIARKAIAERVAKLEAGESAGNLECRDLKDALNKLQILSVCQVVGMPSGVSTPGFGPGNLA